VSNEDRESFDEANRVITHLAVPVEVILSRDRELVFEYQTCCFKADTVITLIAGVLGFVSRVYLDIIV
jgi:hypothetical protein